MAIFDMRFRSRRVSRIPWTFIAWWYVRHAALLYLSISNAVDNILRSEPFSVVLASSHSVIPSKGILAIIARTFVNMFAICDMFRLLSIRIMLALEQVDWILRPIPLSYGVISIHPSSHPYV